MTMADHVAAFRAGFDRAAAARPDDMRQAAYHVGGRVLHARVVGRALAELLERPLLRAADGTPASLRLDVWEGGFDLDLEQAGEDGCTHERHGPDGERLAWAEGQPWMRFTARDFALWLDRSAGAVVGWVRAADRLSPWHVYRPLQALVGPWLSSSGGRVFHAAMVARGAAGIVVPGHNNAGKSTTALACLRAGLDVLADDVVALDVADGRPTGYSVYGVIKARQPPVGVDGPVLRVHDHRGSPEYVLFLNAVAPGQLRPSAPLAAIVVPQIVDAVDSDWVAVPRRAALSALLATDLSAGMGGVREAFSAAVTLSEAVPARELRIGRSADGVAAAVDDLLEHVTRP